ncbi:MAG TPA: epoxyqueuosine reductase [Deltaproteobacteria bacterium]|nr:epoxyqueuosine reductase [Deltaproteobacteria bacterium]
MMSETMKESIIRHLKDSVSAVGFAPVERFVDAPEKHHPSRVCKDAKTVVVFGIQIPRGILESPDYNLYGLHRSYHTVYRKLDEISLNLCNFIEAQGKYSAVMIPSYAPLVFHELEPWGLISLKHAAVRAGLGAFGHSGQMYHPVYGSRLRLAAVVTSAQLSGDPLIEKDPCPPKCSACQKACPANAFSKNGSFKKMTCMAYAIKHAIYPLALKDAEGFKHIERVINTAGHDYWIDCDECLKVCPNNR